MWPHLGHFCICAWDWTEKRDNFPENVIKDCLSTSLQYLLTLIVILKCSSDRLRNYCDLNLNAKHFPNGRIVIPSPNSIPQVDITTIILCLIMPKLLNYIVTKTTLLVPLLKPWALISDHLKFLTNGLEMHCR